MPDLWNTLESVQVKAASRLAGCPERAVTLQPMCTGLWRRFTVRGEFEPYQLSQSQITPSDYTERGNQ